MGNNQCGCSKKVAEANYFDLRKDRKYRHHKANRPCDVCWDPEVLILNMVDDSPSVSLNDTDK